MSPSQIAPPPPEWQMLDQWHSKPRHIRVIHVGAGAAGLLMAYKMKKMATDYELVCYEKNPEVSGTWYENRYPGCACDIPAHNYTFPFEPNPNWSSFYAYAPEIKQYFVDFANKYDLMPYVQLNTKVVSAVWDEEKGTYEVEVEHDGQRKKDYCHVLVNGTGFLNSWKWPKIPGLFDFKGALLHSANWDPSTDYKDKRVAVIGTGSSAIQIIPQMQKAAKHVYSFMRSVTWISPPISANVLEETKKASEHEVPPNAQYYFSEEEKKEFRENPEHHLAYRRKLEEGLSAGFDMFTQGSDLSKMVEDIFRAEMLRRIGPGHEDLKERLIPSWPPGCRRLTPGDGYLEALVQPNVTPVYQEIGKIVPNGLVGEDGTFYEVDVIVCATGFNLAFAPSFEVKGDHGVVLRDEFDPEPQVYLSFAVPKFPNYFIINGPRGNWASGSALASHEPQVEYIVKFIKKIQEDNIKSVEVKQAAVDDFYQYVDTWHKNSVFSAPCKSWYKNNVIGGKLWVYGGSGVHYMKTIKDPKYEHYNYKYHDDNMFAYLGNGRIEAEWKKEVHKLAPYIRNSDVPWDF